MTIREALGSIFAVRAARLCQIGDMLQIADTSVTTSRPSLLRYWRLSIFTSFGKTFTINWLSESRKTLVRSRALTLSQLCVTFPRRLDQYTELSI